MAQNISLLGADYPNVPAVQLPKTGGGTAQFDDTTDATATASEIASGKSAYVNGTRLLGTGQMVEPPLYIDPSINGVGIGATPENDHELTIANGYHINAKGKYNIFNYMPYSFNATGTSGTAGYARIATVTVTGSAYTQTPIHFKGIRRTDDTTFDLYFSLYGAASDPPLNAFLADFPINTVSGVSPFEAFAYKTATSTWDIYVQKCTGSDQITVWTDVPQYAQNGYTVTYSQGQLSSVPSGATMATQKPNTAKDNTFTYMPYSAVVAGSGSDSYLKIASISVYGTWAYGSIVFDVRRLYDYLSVRLALYFETGSGTTPTNVSLRYESLNGTYVNRPFSAFIVQTNSVLDLYVNKSTTGSEKVTVSTYSSASQLGHVNITYPGGQLASIPSGAKVALPAQPIVNGRTFTRTSGGATISDIALMRYGSLCVVAFTAINGSASTDVGANGWVGTTNLPKPIYGCSAVAYSGQTCLVAYLNTSASLSIRVTGSPWIATYDSTKFTLVYFTNENLP